MHAYGDDFVIVDSRNSLTLYVRGDTERQMPWPFTQVSPRVGSVHLLFNIAAGRVFKGPQVYFLKATKPCAVAYGYARIRRLVRLEPRR
jgi:hypothetical protein